MYIYGARGSILYGARVRRRVRTFGAQFTGSELTSQGPLLGIKDPTVPPSSRCLWYPGLGLPQTANISQKHSSFILKITKHDHNLRTTPSDRYWIMCPTNIISPIASTTTAATTQAPPFPYISWMCHLCGSRNSESSRLCQNGSCDHVRCYKCDDDSEDCHSSIGTSSTPDQIGSVVEQFLMQRGGVEASRVRRLGLSVDRPTCSWY